jgi:hypothetical protein
MTDSSESRNRTILVSTDRVIVTFVSVPLAPQKIVENDQEPPLLSKFNVVTLGQLSIVGELHTTWHARHVTASSVTSVCMPGEYPRHRDN